MDNNIDFDVDELDKDFEKINKEKILKKIKDKELNKKFDFVRMGIITVCLILISIIVYINRRDAILREFEQTSNSFVSSDLYNCDISVQEKANQLKPTPPTEIDDKTKQLNSLGKDLSLEKANLEKIKKELTVSPDPSRLEVYKRDVELYNDRLEDYQSESAIHQKEINEYNEKVRLYYAYLKANCVATQ